MQLIELDLSPRKLRHARVAMRLRVEAPDLNFGECRLRAMRVSIDLP